MTTQNQAVSAKANPVQTIRQMLEKSKAQIVASLPVHLNVDRLMRLAMTAIQRNSRLLECSPISLIGAIIRASQLGLEINSDTNQAHLVPFRNAKKNRTEVQLMIGYKGLERLAIRTEQVKRIMARAVYKGDQFSYHYGLSPDLIHQPANGTNELTHVYAIAYMTDGTKEFLVMSKEEIETKARARSKSKDNGPWVTDYEDMCLKTVVRRLCKRLPNSSDKTEPLHAAIALEEKAMIGVSQDLAMDADPSETPTEIDAPGNPIPEPTAQDNGVPFPPAPSNKGNQIDRTGLTTMQSKYDSKCIDCGDKITKGEDICYDPKTKKALHLECGNVQQ